MNINAKRTHSSLT